MADFLTHFSCVLDVGTVTNVARAFDVHRADGRVETAPTEPFLLSLTPEHGATRPLAARPGTADPPLLITFVTRCAEAFALTGTWGFQWAGIPVRPCRRRFLRRRPSARSSTGRTIAIDQRRWLAEGGAR